MIYECYAVSNHIGSADFGHYIAYVRNVDNNKWYEMNDTAVKEIP